MKTYKKPEIELSSFDTDIIATSGEGLTVDEVSNGVFTAPNTSTMNFPGENGEIGINPFN